MLPNSSDLTYFIEIAQTENLSQAAVRLGVSQPSLSLALNRLENSVGAKLFHRSKKGVALTPAGRELFVHARALLEQWAGVQARALATHEEVKGQFVVGCHASVALYTLPQITQKWFKDYPELELTFVHDLSRKILDEILNVRIDIGIVVNPFPHPDLVIKKICEDEVAFWTHEKLPKDLEKTLICDPELMQTQDLIKKAKKAGFSFERIIKSSNLEVVAELTKAGCGVGILPSRVAQRSSDTLVKKRQSPLFKDEIALVYRHENRSVKAIQVLAQGIQLALS